MLRRQRIARAASCRRRRSPIEARRRTVLFGHDRPIDLAPAEKNNAVIPQSGYCSWRRRSRSRAASCPNGLRYYVRANKKPEKRAELRLVVKAGSILEDDDQQGLAHFVEHMAFNGTQHFPKQEVVSFLESLGMRFGADVNAYTSFDETVYTLTVPTDKPEAMDRSLLILEDWAHNVSFDPAEIDKERGVVMEEWRLRRGAPARGCRRRCFPVLLKGSRYAERRADRQDRDHPELQARAAEEVLRGLVPART